MGNNFLAIETNQSEKLVTCSKDCPMAQTLKLVGGKWKILILWQLNRQQQRFSDLLHTLPGVSHKVLASQLKELEEDGLIIRNAFPEVPPRVEYSLSRIGKDFQPVLESISDFGDHYNKSSKGKIDKVS